MRIEEFADWKRHPVTQEVFSRLQARIDDMVEELIEQTATADSGRMAEKAGAIKAYRDLVLIQYEGEDSHGS